MQTFVPRAIISVSYTSLVLLHNTLFKVFPKFVLSFWATPSAATFAISMLHYQLHQFPEGGIDGVPHQLSFSLGESPNRFITSV